jgi:hypothetical protein
MKDGVLFIPGSEALGFLIYPKKSMLDRMDLKGADFVNTVTADNGLIFAWTSSPNVTFAA